MTTEREADTVKRIKLSDKEALFVISLIMMINKLQDVAEFEVLSELECISEEILQKTPEHLRAMMYKLQESKRKQRVKECC